MLRFRCDAHSKVSSVDVEIIYIGTVLIFRFLFDCGQCLANF